jgi:hypothetical protein
VVQGTGDELGPRQNSPICSGPVGAHQNRGQAPLERAVTSWEYWARASELADQKTEPRHVGGGGRTGARGPERSSAEEGDACLVHDIAAGTPRHSGPHGDQLGGVGGLLFEGTGGGTLQWRGKK